jgi:triosephosphate isomerase
MPKKLIIGNWKMNPTSVGEAIELLEIIHNHLSVTPPTQYTLVVCPPFVFIEEVSKLTGNDIILGAQDISLSDEAAQTGEISGEMLARLGVHYVIIGHSERRWKLNEPDEIIRKKVRMALDHNITPIVCIGERQRDADFAEFIKQQIDNSLQGLNDIEKEKCVIAYEPVWAISTNPGAQPDTPSGALESIAVIRVVLPQNVVLYGGSVTPENVSPFLSESGIDGVLVGGASVRREDFLKILTAGAKL